MTAPRDWDKELAEIDKLMASPAAQSQVPARAAPGGPAPAPKQLPGPPPATGRAAWGTWLKVGLVALLGGAMTQWPYAHACGAGLFLYLGAVGVVTLGGLWAAIGTWRRRMGLAHVVALGVTLWGLLLAAGVILPRAGYARATATWWCP